MTDLKVYNIISDVIYQDKKILLKHINEQIEKKCLELTKELDKLNQENMVVKEIINV